MSNHMIEVTNFCKVYGAYTAVDNITFNVQRGEIFGLLGPNGADKTSTLESLEGLRAPDGGTLRVAGVDPTTEPHKLRNLIGVISPNSRLTVLYSQLFFLPSMIIGGVMLPYDILPAAAAKIALLLPSTYAMNAFNGLVMGGTAYFAPWGAVLTLFIGGMVAFLLAWFLFRWDSQNTERRAHPALALLALLPYAPWILLV